MGGDMLSNMCPISPYYSNFLWPQKEKGTTLSTFFVPKRWHFEGFLAFHLPIGAFHTRTLRKWFCRDLYSQYSKWKITHYIYIYIYIYIFAYIINCGFDLHYDHY